MGGALDDYRQRLADWVERERKAENPELSYVDLAFKISQKLGKSKAIQPQTLHRWHNKEIKDKLKDDTIAKLAIYLDKTPEQIRAWLDGKEAESPEPKPVDVFRYLDTAPLDEISKIAQAALDRLSKAAEVAAQYQARQKQELSPIAKLIADFLERENLSQLEFELAVQSHSKINPEALRLIMAGQKRPTNRELGQIGTVLRDENGNPYSFDSLKAIRDKKSPTDKRGTNGKH